MDDEELNEDQNLEQLKDAAIAATNGEVDYDAITAETFANVGYQDLLEEFTKLGLGSAWTPGKSKSFMIKKALSKCAELKELKAKGIEGDEADEIADKAVDLKEQVAEKEVVAKEAKDQQTTAEARAAELNRIKDMDLDDATLQSALDNTNANLNNAPSEIARNIMLMKQSVLMELLGQK